MQRPDERKRQQITAAAARMFATRPFHKVRLEDIAAAAGVGKGTLYIYFADKDALYFSLIYDGFARLVDGLRAQLEDGGVEHSAVHDLGRIVTELVAFAFRPPDFFELMRTAAGAKARSEPAGRAKRKELGELIEQTIRRGVRRGELADPHPELTAMCIPGLVRSVMLFAPRHDISEQKVTTHIMRLLSDGIVKAQTGVNGTAMKAKASATVRLSKGAAR